MSILPKNKILKTVIILAAVYVGIVVLFESLLGYFQPANQATMVVTTFSDDGERHERVVSRLNSNEQLYVAVNHWPRAWYRRTQDQPDIMVDLGEGAQPYRSVQISGAEYDRVHSETDPGVVFRILTGFPRRHILRLDPR
jgi:hypothetical protein